MTYRPGLLSVVSATQTSLIRPDGTQVVLDTSNVPISGLTDAATLPSSTALGPMKLHGSLGGVDYFVTLSTAFNSQTKPISALDPVPSLASGDKFPVYSVASGAPVMSCTFSQLVAAVQAAIGGGSSATAPSQVGSLAAGTPTSTTIPITYTAATGTAPITYAASTAPHGGGTFTGNSGTFGATGGTLTGLTAATNYDVKIIATNSAGSSTTTLLTGLSTAAASAAGPSMTFNPADSYVTTGQKFGAGALSGGKGTLQFTVPQFPGSSVATMGVADLEFWFKAATTSFTGNAAFLKMVDSAGTEWGLKFGGQNFTSTYGAGDYATGNIRDGSWHHIRMNVRSDYNQQNYIEVLVDGGAKQPIKYDATPGIKTGTATLTIDFANAAAGDLIDEVWITSDSRQTVPSTAGVRDSATLVLLHLDGSGAGS